VVAVFERGCVEELAQLLPECSPITATIVKRATTMAKRSIRKIRETLPAPSFKERVAAGKKGQQATRDLWLKHGIVKDEPIYEPKSEPNPHVHSDQCDHEHDK
jgi:hypothetical protein